MSIQIKINFQFNMALAQDSKCILGNAYKNEPNITQLNLLRLPNQSKDPSTILFVCFSYIHMIKQYDIYVFIYIKRQYDIYTFIYIKLHVTNFFLL
jgi:hypothetical protein